MNKRGRLFGGEAVCWVLTIGQITRFTRELVGLGGTGKILHTISSHNVGFLVPTLGSHPSEFPPSFHPNVTFMSDYAATVSWTHLDYVHLPVGLAVAAGDLVQG